MASELRLGRASRLADAGHMQAQRFDVTHIQLHLLNLNAHAVCDLAGLAAKASHGCCVQHTHKHRCRSV